ncbi:unnamed protein product [Mucor hiemalis]
MSYSSDTNPNLTPERKDTERQGVEPSNVPQESLAECMRDVPSFVTKNTYVNPSPSDNKDTSSKSKVEVVGDQLEEVSNKAKQAMSGSQDEGSGQSALKVAKEETISKIPTSSAQESEDNKSQEVEKESQVKEHQEGEMESMATDSLPTESNPTKSALSESLPTESLPTESIPTESLPKESSLKDDSPMECTPKDSCGSDSYTASQTTSSDAPKFDESDDLISLIIADHNKVKQLYENYKQEDDHSKKRTIANELIRTLVSHDECEQFYLYPLLKEKLTDDKKNELYDEGLKEHQEQRELLYEVKKTDINKEFEKYDSTLKKAMESFFHHIGIEESKVLSDIQKSTTEDELKKVGASFKAHKPLCTTRPHPDAPQTGFSARAGNILLAPFDVVRDFFEN